MSKQLAISSAFSILMMACYVLFGADAVHEGPGFHAMPALTGTVEISAPELPDAGTLLPSLR